MRIYKHFNENSQMMLFCGDCFDMLKEIPNEYVDLIISSPPYCIKYLTDYFSAIRQIYIDEWFDSSSKLLSVITFNSFILALKKDLLLHGNKARDYYLEHFSKHKFDFSNENFLYTSSQYNKFSDEIIDKCFG